jgi:pimeloyl-ACP methyl ester carboxylesterase
VVRLERHEVVVDGTRIGLLAGGAGPPVVLLHGFIGACDYWSPVARRLAERRRVLALDLPGHGRSALLAPFAFAGCADLLARAVAAIGVEQPPALVGHSLGAALAVSWAARHAVSSLALVSPVGASPLRVDRARWALPLGRVLAGAPLRGLCAHSRLARRLVFGWFVGMSRLDRLDAATARALLAGAAAAAPAVPGYLPAIGALDVRPDLGAVRVPALVAWGEHDRVGARDGRTLAGALAARTLELDGVGHMPMLEDPDRLAGALAAFV